VTTLRRSDAEKASRLTLPPKPRVPVSTPLQVGEMKSIV
jgi:hypothetical protein